VPKGSYEPQGGGTKVEPLEAGQYNDCVLEKIFAFRQKKLRDDTNETEYMQVKLALYWDSGYVIPDTDEPYYFTHGFMNFSFDERANFAKMLEALGFIEEAGDPAEFEYELGGDHAGQGFDSLPIYAGTGPKKDIEVPVETLKINGRELIGTKASLVVSKKANGYNNIELVMAPPSENEQAKGPRKAPAKKAEAPDGTTALAARESSNFLWQSWRNKRDAINWATTMKNNDGSTAYPTKQDVEIVWEALWTAYANEVRNATRQDFMQHWHGWHVAALRGETYSFNDAVPPFTPN
jgi:hypothetical protein